MLVCVEIRVYVYGRERERKEKMGLSSVQCRICVMRQIGAAATIEGHWGKINLWWGLSACRRGIRDLVHGWMASFFFVLESEGGTARTSRLEGFFLDTILQQ